MKISDPMAHVVSNEAPLRSSSQHSTAHPAGAREGGNRDDNDGGAPLAPATLIVPATVVGGDNGSPSPPSLHGHGLAPLPNSKLGEILRTLSPIRYRTEYGKGFTYTRITYSVKQMLHKLPSPDTLTPKYGGKSSLGEKICAIIWTVLAVTLLFSPLFSPTPIFFQFTHWDFVWKQWYSQYYFDQNDTGILNYTGTCFDNYRDFEYTYSAMGQDYHNSTFYDGWYPKVFDRRFWSSFLDQHPPGSNFTVYYNPNDPSDFVLQPGVRASQFVVPMVFMTVTYFLLMLCFQPILNSLSAKGEQLPIFMERRSTKVKRSIGTFNLGGDTDGPVETPESGVYRIQMKQRKELRFFFLNLMHFSLCLASLYGCLVAMFVPELSIVILCLPPLLTFYAFYNDENSIELDTANNIFCHRNFCCNDFIGAFIIIPRPRLIGFLCRKDHCIDMNQIKDIHLQVTDSYYEKYKVILVHQDEVFDPNGRMPIHSNITHKEHLIFETESDEEVMELLTLLLKSDSCLKLPEEDGACHTNMIQSDTKLKLSPPVIEIV